METDQIAVEDSKKQLFSDWQNSVDFTTGEWRVQEEANLDVLLRRSNLLS